MQTDGKTAGDTGFSRTLLDFYRGAMLTLMIDLGYRTGLLEAAARGPGTSQQLAERAGLDERYVREWLGAMTVGGVFTYDPASREFTLPAEHAACLVGRTRANLAPRSQLIALLGARLPRVAECFRHGGGVPYSEYRPDFTRYQASAANHRHDVFLLDGYLAVAPGVLEALERGVSVADIGCGTGHAVNLMAAQFPASRFVGFDIAADAIERARTEAARQRLTNARFEVLDLGQLPARPKFDLITAFDVIHDQAQPATVLQRVRDALADDGIFLMLDLTASSNLEENVATPDRAFSYGVSVLHCMTVSLAEAGAGLGTMWGEQLARQMLANAGFSRVQVLDAADGRNSVYLCRA